MTRWKGLSEHWYERSPVRQHHFWDSNFGMVRYLKLPYMVTNMSQRLWGLGLAWAHGGHAQKKYQNFTNFSPKNFAIWRTKDWFLRKMVISPSIGHGSIKDLVEKNFENFQPLPAKMGQSWNHTLSKKSRCPKLPVKFFWLGICIRLRSS